MKFAVLCGGSGTGLREETEFRPKPTAEIGGRPILWHIMKIYGHYGMHEFPSAGFFVFNRRIFDYLNGPQCVLERAPLERLAREGQLMAYRHDVFSFAMDTYCEYQYLNELWASEKAPWKVWAK